MLIPKLSICAILLITFHTNVSASKLSNSVSFDSGESDGTNDESASPEEETQQRIWAMEHNLDKQNGGKIWAVLVAGSNEWYNYRHQADVCHAYHVLINHGVPAENIITMLYDDIANNSANPYKGKIFNGPEGRDVFAGVKIDYAQKDVTVENFIAILEGNSSGVKGGTGRVLQSNKNDKLFIFFSDHGSVGLIAFPDEILHVKTLKNTLVSMHDNERYDELTFYLEACESGSMFEHQLSKELKVYAMTASNADESSWGCYCDTKILPDICLGDLFSVNWMEDSDKEDLKTETLETQYTIVKKLTKKSHVMQFGDFDITGEHVSDFQGNQLDLTARRNSGKSSPANYAQFPSVDIPLIMLERQLARENDKTIKGHLSHKVHVMRKKRRYLEEQIVGIVRKLVHDPVSRDRVLKIHPAQLTQIDCHYEVVHTFHRLCFNLGRNAYALKYGYVLANLCELRLETERIKQVLMDHCLDIEIDGIV